MSLVDIVKHALPMKLADGKRHVWPTLASMVYLKDGKTPLVNENGELNADNAEKLGGESPDHYAVAKDLDSVIASEKTTPTVNGSVIAINDASTSPLRKLVIHGKTTQNGTPTPDSPVALVTTGSGGTIEAFVARKNLVQFTPQTIENNGITFTINSDGTVTANGTATDGTAINIPVITVTGATYILSGCPSGGGGNSYLLQISNFGNDIGNGWTGSATEKTADRVTVWIAGGTTVNNLVFRPMVREVNFASESEYETGSFQTFTLSTPNGLPGIPVTSGGNYTDANGQQWICDEIDLERGVKIQRTQYHSERVYTGDVSSAGGLAHVNITSVLYPIKNLRAVMCNLAPLVIGDTYDGIANRGWASTSPCVSSTNNNTVRLYLPANSAYDAEILVALDEPIVTNLTDSELSAYRALVTNNPNTTIYNDAGADMTVQYVTNSAKNVATADVAERALDADKLNGNDADYYASASDLALRIGAPNYANFVTLMDETPTTAKESILETTMDADGYIFLIFNTASATAAPYMMVLVNGTPAMAYSQGDTPQTYIQRTSPIVPVKKGDTVKCSIYGVGATSNDLVAGGRRTVRFIPQRTGA